MVDSLHASDSEPMAREPHAGNRKNSWASKILLKIIIFVEVVFKLTNYVTLRVDENVNAL
jgi:hypothetical protein